MKYWVLMLNDWPVGVYDSEQAAKDAGEMHRQTNFAHPHTPLYYRAYWFELNAKARF